MTLPEVRVLAADETSVRFSVDGGEPRSLRDNGRSDQVAGLWRKHREEGLPLSTLIARDVLGAEAVETAVQELDELRLYLAAKDHTHDDFPRLRDALAGHRHDRYEEAYVGLDQRHEATLKQIEALKEENARLREVLSAHRHLALEERLGALEAAVWRLAEEKASAAHTHPYAASQTVADGLNRLAEGLEALGHRVVHDFDLLDGRLGDRLTREDARALLVDLLATLRFRRRSRQIVGGDPVEILEADIGTA